MLPGVATRLSSTTASKQTILKLGKDVSFLSLRNSETSLNVTQNGTLAREQQRELWDGPASGGRQEGPS